MCPARAATRIPTNAPTSARYTPPGMEYLFIPALLLLTASAIAVLVALRGRRTDDHPLCRRCKFDLIGKPESSIVCPECGADVAKDRAIRTGHRAPHRRLLLASGAILTACLLVLALLSAAFLAGPRSLPYKPIFWLAADLRSGSPADQSAAAGELLARYNSKKLTTAQLSPLIDTLLAYQADSNRPWSVEWGSFVERAHAAGAVSDARWRTYLTQMVTFTPALRPIVRRGDPVPIHVILHARCGAATSGYVFELAAAIPIDTAKPLDRWKLGASLRNGDNAWDITASVDPWVLTTASNGATTLPLRLEVRFPSNINAYPEPPPRAVCVFAGRLATTLVPAGQPTVHPFADPDLARPIANSIKLSLATPLNTTMDDLIRIDLDAKPSAPIAYEVSIRTAAGDEYGPVSLAAGVPGASGGLSTFIDVPNAPAIDTVDVLLRPSPRLAASQFAMTRYFDQPILLPNVAVQHLPVSVTPRPTTHPAAFPTTLPHIPHRPAARVARHTPGARP